MNKAILAENTQKVKCIKPVAIKGEVISPDSDGFWQEVARVKAGGDVFGVVDSPAGLICQCRPLIEQLDDESQPCPHVLAVALFVTGGFEPLPL